MLEDVIEEYFYYCQAKGFTKKTMINKRQELKQLKMFLFEKRAVKELESVTIHDLKAYMTWKQKEELQATSIVSMFKLIRAFFNWCVKEDYLTENIAKKVELPKMPKKVIKGFTQKEVQSMIDAFSFKNYIDARNKAMIAMMADCGLRAMEIRGLLSENVKETTILVNGKGNKERVVFVSPALKRILIKYERIKREYFRDREIMNNYFLNYSGDSLSHAGLWNSIKEAGKRVGIQDKRVSPHTFRHFYAVQCLTNGKIDVYSLSRLLGHSDITVTQRYLHTMNNEQLLDKAITSSPLMNFKKMKQ
ncbi:tyrosine-type recombinase/integrase [Cytobacillus praedii]|uniref:tyrosine-type recombinase/integrase n=1 Tax=Cytobacillus praedii TaxID=1742358 RepID=UPI000B304A6E|nr:tyrosine-type recombinase/integrase [Cytobacillus praedii]